MPNFNLSLHRFPDTSPDFEMIADDPVFDPAIHLELGQPEHVLTLNELGYGDEIKGTTPTDIAATSCFRVLSDEGVEAMYHVCKQLEAFTTSNPRISRNTRGGTYRSHFLRDFSISVDIAEHISALMKTPLLPHAMCHQLSHLNYQPLTVGEAVDKWHYDTLQADFVMFVTDPNTVEGGEFQYFKGTRDEMAAIHKAGETIPQDRVISPSMPGAGYAVMMQGNYVVHQARGITSEGERITLVNGYNYADVSIPDFTALNQLVHADPANYVTAEYTRQMALRCAQHLQPCINDTDFNADRQQQIQRLQRARAELDEAIALLEDETEVSLKHFGD